MLSRRLLLIAGAATLFTGAALFVTRQANEDGAFADAGRGIDDVTLTNSSGEIVRWRELADAPRAVFFGFTHCPVICPVTVYELTAAVERIGASDVRIDFITVDPERDTPERMREYFSGFGPMVTGYTGSTEALQRVRDAFEITATRSVLEGGGYTVDHTATVFLIDQGGRVRDVIAYGAEPDVIDARLRELVSR